MRIEAGTKLTVRKDLKEGCFGRTFVNDEMATYGNDCFSENND